MAHGRKVFDEGEARRCLRAAKRAGQRPGEWAREHGIDGRSLHAWLVNLEQRGVFAPRRRRARAQTVPHAMVEVIPDAEPEAATARYVVVVGDARLEFGDDARAATLRRVVEALRTC